MPNDPTNTPSSSSPSTSAFTRPASSIVEEVTRDDRTPEEKAADSAYQQKVDAGPEIKAGKGALDVGSMTRGLTKSEPNVKTVQPEKTAALLGSDKEFWAELKDRGKLQAYDEGKSLSYDKASFDADLKKQFVLADLGYDREEIEAGLAEEKVAEYMGLEPGYTPEEFMGKTRELVAGKVKDADDFGTVFHRTLDDFFNKPPQERETYLDPRMRGYHEQAMEQVNKLSPYQKIFLQNFFSVGTADAGLMFADDNFGRQSGVNTNLEGVPRLDLVKEAYMNMPEDERQQVLRLMPAVVNPAIDRMPYQEADLWRMIVEGEKRNIENLGLGFLDLMTKRGQRGMTDQEKRDSDLDTDLYAKLRRVRDTKQGKIEKGKEFMGFDMGSFKQQIAGTVSEMLGIMTEGPGFILGSSLDYELEEQADKAQGSLAQSGSDAIRQAAKGTAYYYAGRAQIKYLSPGKFGGSFLKQTGKRFAGEVGQELVQEGVPMLIDEVVSRYSDDVNAPDWKASLEGLAEAGPEAAVMMLLLSGAASGISISKDAFKSKALARQTADPDMLVMNGVPQADADRIAALATPKERLEAVTRLQENGGIDPSQEVSEEVQARVMEKLRAESGEDVPTFAPQIMQLPDGTVRVQFPDDRAAVVVDTPEAAMAAARNWAEERIAENRSINAELQGEDVNLEKLFEAERVRLETAQPGLQMEGAEKQTLMQRHKLDQISLDDAVARVQDFAMQEAADMEGVDPDEHAAQMVEAFTSGKRDFMVAGSADSNARIENGLLHGAITLLNGDKSVEVLWEEALESHFHGMVNSGRTTIDELRAMVKQIEKDTGKRILSGKGDRAVIEALSFIGKGYAANELNLIQGEARGIFDKLLQILMDIVGMAKQISDLKAAGQLDPKLEENFRAGLGLDGGALYAQDVGTAQEDLGIDPTLAISRMDADHISRVTPKDDKLRAGTSMKDNIVTDGNSNISRANVDIEVLDKQMLAMDYDHLPASIRNETNPVKKADKLIDWFAKNLLYLHDNFDPAHRARATHWYDGANRLAKRFAKKQGITPQQAAGVMAVFSPQKDWFMNVAQAEQTIDVYQNYRRHKLSEARVREHVENAVNATMVSAREGKGKTTRARKMILNRKKAVRRALLEPLIGKSIAELEKMDAATEKEWDIAEKARYAREVEAYPKQMAAWRKLYPKERGQKSKAGKKAKPRRTEPRKFEAQRTAWGIRLMAQSVHGVNFRVLSPEGDTMRWQTNQPDAKGNEARTKNTWGSSDEILKAVSIMRDGSMANISDQMGQMHKVRNFYNNIIAPNSPFGDATMDTHAIAAAHLLPMGSGATEVKHNFGDLGIGSSGKHGVVGNYWLYLEAYRRAAAARGLQPRQMQSITWEAIRLVYSSAQRSNAKFIAEKRNTWQKDPRNARRSLVPKRIPTPAWAGRGNSGDPDLEPGGVRGPGAGDVAGGGGGVRGSGASGRGKRTAVGKTLSITPEMRAAPQFKNTPEIRRDLTNRFGLAGQVGPLTNPTGLFWWDDEAGKIGAFVPLSGERVMAPPTLSINAINVADHGGKEITRPGGHISVYPATAEYAANDVASALGEDQWEEFFDADNEGRLSEALLGIPSDAKVARLGGLLVDENMRGKKVGARLLTAAEHEARKMGATHMVIWAGDIGGGPSAGFYQKMGYKVKMDTPHGDKILTHELVPSQTLAITPEQDADYMAAVAANDEVMIQRMVDQAAQAAGFTTKGYHGTRDLFDVFNFDKLGQSGFAEGVGFYFTDDRKTAEGYNRGSDGRTIDAWLKMKNAVPLDHPPLSAAVMNKVLDRAAQLELEYEEDPEMDIRDTTVMSNGLSGELLSNDLTFADQVGGIVNSGVRAEDIMRAIVEVAGIDGIVSDGFDGAGVAGGQIYVIFGPSQIKSADPITRDKDGEVIPLSKRFNKNENSMTLSIRAAGREWEIRSTDAREGSIPIMTDLAKFDAHWKKDTESYVDGTTGAGQIEPRLERFDTWLQDNPHDIVEMPQVGMNGFTNGRHRTAHFIARGEVAIPMSVDRDSVEEFQEKFGYYPTGSVDADQQAWNALEAEAEYDKVILAPQVRKTGEVRPYAVVVPKGERKQGLGSKYMQKMIDLADKQGRTMVLSPSLDLGATSIARLRKFYGRFGFKRNLGKNKDFRFSEAMIRLPKGGETGSNNAPAYALRAFHGTDANFTEALPFTMFSINQEYSRQIGKKTIQAELNIEKPADLASMHISPSQRDIIPQLEKLKAQGYDGAHYKGEAWIIFDSSQALITNTLAIRPAHDTTRNRVEQNFMGSEEEMAEVYGKMLQEIERIEERMAAQKLLGDVAKTTVIRVPVNAAGAIVAGEIDGFTTESETGRTTTNLNPAQKKVLKRELAKHPEKSTKKFIEVRTEENVDRDSKFDSLQAIAVYDAILTALPGEARGRLGGFAKLSELTTEDARRKFLESKLPQIEQALDRYVRKKTQKKLAALLDKNKLKADKSGVMKGKGAKFQDELDAIRAVLVLDTDEVATMEAAEEALLSTADDLDVIDASTERLIRLNTYGRALANGKAARPARDVLAALADLSHIVSKGVSRYRMVQEAEQARRKELAKMAVDTITGGKGAMGEAAEKAKELLDEKRKLRGAAHNWHLKNQSWEWLVNAASREGKEGTLKSKLTKWASRLAHLATHTERRTVRAKTEEQSRFLARVFGVKTKGPWRFRLSRHLGEFADRKTSTGVHRVELRPTEKTVTIPVSKARQVVDGTVTAKSMGLIDLDVAALEAMLEENDAKPANRQKKNLELQHRTEGPTTEQTLSQDEAVQLTMLYAQDGSKEAMQHWGYTESTMAEMEAFLTDEAKAIRDWLRVKYKDGWGELNPTYAEVFGHTMPQIKNYSPGRWHHAGGGKDIADLMMEETTVGASTTPGFAKNRITHRARPRQDVGALTLYSEHFKQSAHFVAWAKPMKDLRAAFLNKETQQAIKQYGGRTMQMLINDKLDQFANGGSRILAERTLDWLRRNFTIGALAFNWGVMVKQLSSLPAFMFDMPVGAFLKYEGRAMRDWKGLKELWESEFVQDRFSTGFDRDVALVLQRGASKNGRGKIEWAVEQGMITGRLGDIAPVIFGGYAVYHYHLDQAKARGATDTVAKAEAMVAFEMSVERAQQASDIKDQSYFQGQSSVHRLFSMFLTSPRQYYSNVYESLMDFKAGHPGAGKEFLKRFIIGHIVLPFAFQFISDIARNVKNLSDDDDETGLLDLNPADYVKAFLLGPLNGIFVVGHALSTVAGHAVNGLVEIYNAAQEDEKTHLEKTRVWGYRMPIIEHIEDIGPGVIDVLTGMKGAIEKPNLESFGALLNGIGKTAKLGGGPWMSYDIGHRVVRSFGLDDEIARSIQANTTTAGIDIKKARADIYALDAEEYKAKKTTAWRKEQIDTTRHNELASRTIDLLSDLDAEEIAEVIEALPKSTLVKAVQKKVFPAIDYTPPKE